MPRRSTPLVAGQCYHVYNRGNNRERTFFERENYLFFLKRIREILVGDSRPARQQGSSAPNGQPLCTVIAYCLMPNHYHLLVCPTDDQFSRCMQRLSISYTKAVNKRYDRVGALFQGKFRALQIDRNEQLLHLSRYIHLNPVEAGLVKRAEDWEFSSYRDYVGLRKGSLPNCDVILSQFAGSGGYRNFVESTATTNRYAISHLPFGDG